MKMKKIVSIVGARPQFIKAAIVCKKLREHGFEEKLVHTGQHYDFDMSDVFFQELELPEPDHYLHVGSGSHGEQTGKMLIELEKTLLKESPDFVLVYGDTNTTLAGALAASKLHIPIGHVEAGLRSYNRRMPEEVNRVLADHVSDILFCPSTVAVDNLRKEGFTNIANNGALIDLHQPPTTIHHPHVLNVGDVMFDLAMELKCKVNEKEILEKYNLTPEGFILVTVHRADNTDNRDNLKNIWDALLEIALKDMIVVFPIHPRTSKALNELNVLSSGLPDGLLLAKPVSYKEMIVLENNAKVVITDSGGVQKESYFFKTPCVIPRNETEWVELLHDNWATLTGANKSAIVDVVLNEYKNNKIREWKPFYGNGNAGENIVKYLDESIDG